MTSPHVCAIVSNRDGWEHLRVCLPSLEATRYEPFAIVLVDNASTDDSLARVEESHPDVVRVASPVNRGVAGGNNLGLARARELGARYVLFANNDIRVDPRWAEVAVEVAESQPRIGVLGFRVIEAQRDEDQAFERAVAEWRETEVRDVPTVDGMAMFVPVSLLDELGAFDDAFFAYAEDTDLVYRARRAGYRVAAVNLPVWHYGGGSFGQTPIWAGWLQIRNDLRLSLKHDAPTGMLYQLGRHFALACLPLVKIDRSDRVVRRLRPSNPVVNFGIFVGAVLWNLWHLPGTLRRRRSDAATIRSARRRSGHSRGSAT
jgi:GT2 family glycosyltransferase